MQVIHTHIFLFLSIGSFIHFLIQSNKVNHTALLYLCTRSNKT